MTYNASAFSPCGGPLQVSYSNFWQPFSNAIGKGLSKLGLSSIAGLNSGELLGFSEFTITVDPKSATRSSSESSMLQTTLQNSNAQFYQQTTAKQVLFNSNKTAYAVNVETAGRAYVVSARKEVVVAAGVVRSRYDLITPGFAD